MGGEKSPGRALRCCIRGSPPRGRGKETRPLLCRFSSGITPAWAGKSRPVSPPHRPHRDHPRMGGEKRQALSAAHGSAGSPPRGRGKIHGVACHIDAVGITPAWAGKSSSDRGWRFLRRDHPRVGGEKSGSVFALGRSSGSPPRGRGKGLGLAVNVLGDGIIPAWAGKSYCPATRSFGSWDHPRVGGEKARPCIAPPPRRGSPPHGRGKVRRPGLLPG